MLGFSFGLLMASLVILSPLLYLLNYAAMKFNAWRLGKEPPGHKIAVNVLLIMAVMFVLGGIAQYQWDRKGYCFNQGNQLISCIIDSAS